MSQHAFGAIILAAGKGTRMRSALPKVMHEIASQPMLGWAVGAAVEAGATHIFLVTAPGHDDVRTYADTLDVNIVHCLQAEQLGTGDAVRAVLPHSETCDRLVVMFGDTPLMRATVLQELAAHRAAVSVLGFEPDDVAAYGRIIMNDAAPIRIVEFKELDETARQITLCNGGAMGIDRSVLTELLPQLSNDNPQGEYYLPHMVALAVANNHATGLVMGLVDDTLGVDTRAGQARAERLMQQRLRRGFLLTGVAMQDPDSVFVSFDTVIGEDVVIEPHVKINTGVSIGHGAVIKAFSHLEGATLGANVQIGPFARLRPGTVVEDEARIGNFVETKKAHIGRGAKVSHLSYIGDAELGEQVNIGAGTITCNYDGYNKHLTKIGTGAFIGSNSSLIAPVEIGAGAYLGSGSTISRDVAADSLVVTRASVRETADWSIKFRAQHEKKDK